MNPNIPGHKVVLTDTGVTIDGHPITTVNDRAEVYPTCDPTCTTINITILAREWDIQCSPDTMARWVRIHEPQVPEQVPEMYPVFPPQRPALPPPPAMKPQVKPPTITPRTPPTPPIRYTTHQGTGTP